MNTLKPKYFVNEAKNAFYLPLAVLGTSNEFQTPQ